MKKIQAVLMILLLSILLTACGPSEEAKPYIEAGDKALAEEDYLNAVVSYTNAYNADESNDIMDKLQGAREKHFEKIKSDTSEQVGEMDYIKAKDSLKVLNESYTDLMSDDEKKDYKKELQRVNNLIEQQKLFNEYLTWAKPYVSELTQIGADWSLAMRKLELGGSTKSSIEQDLRSLIIRNQEALGAIETKAQNVYQPLAETHGILYEVTLQNDSAFVASLGALRSGRAVEEITEAGLPATDARKMLNTTFTSAIRNYATENELKDTYQDIIFTEETVVGTEATTDAK